MLDTTQPGALWADGEKSFVITVTDGAGKSTETRMLLIFDNTAPTRHVHQPRQRRLRSTTRSSLRGANSDNTSLIKVQVRIGMTTAADADTGFVDIVGSKYDWTRSFLSNDFANTDYAHRQRGRHLDAADLPPRLRLRGQRVDQRALESRRPAVPRRPRRHVRHRALLRPREDPLLLT